jgi:hypothetical protein
MKWLVLLAALLIAPPVFGQGAVQPPPAQGAVGPATPMTPAPDNRAKQWLTVVDDHNYNDAYKQMAAAAQGKISLSAWGAKMDQVRAPLGAMASRTLKAVKLTKVLPGMSDGQYATVQFDSSFAHRASAVETVVLTSDKGAWSVMSYSLN